MAYQTRHVKPASEAFFYWAPEELADYRDWCEVSARYRRKKLMKPKWLFQQLTSKRAQTNKAGGRHEQD